MDKKSIASKLQGIREEKNLTQAEFANALCTSRSTISSWEQGKSIPTTDQLIKINEVFNVSVDDILQIKKCTGVTVVPDTSVILKRPRILDCIIKNPKIEQIKIPHIVVSELNYQKDQGKRRQQAWLAMASIKNLQEECPDRIQIIKENTSSGINDKKIIEASALIARNNPGTMVYLLSEDIFFPLTASATSNFSTITLNDFDKKFFSDSERYDKLASANFFSEVQKENIAGAFKAYNGKCDINYIDPSTGFTPLICAIRNKNTKMIELIVNKPETDLNKCDDAKHRLPPLSHAVQLDRIDLIKLLIENGADIDSLSQGTNKGNTALMIAAWHGRNDILKLLIEQGACLNQQDSNGYTALIKACIKKNKKCVEMLIQKTDLKIRSFNGLTAKEYAIKSGDKELISLFSSEIANDR